MRVAAVERLAAGLSFGGDQDMQVSSTSSVIDSYLQNIVVGSRFASLSCDAPKLYFGIDRD
jgi:hypothetical protein